MTLEDQIDNLNTILAANSFPEQPRETLRATMVILEALQHRQKLSVDIDSLFRNNLQGNDLLDARQVFTFIYYRDFSRGESGQLNNPDDWRRSGRSKEDIENFIGEPRRARQAVQLASIHAAPAGIILGYDTATERYYGMNLTFDLSKTDLDRAKRIIDYLASHNLTGYKRLTAVKAAWDRFAGVELEPAQVSMFEEAA